MLPARLRPRAPKALAFAGAATLAIRLAIVAATPDVDTDAYGHFRCGRALLADPTNLGVHWVWLPGYHYLIWALSHLGLGFTSLRVLSTLLQAAAPFLLFDLVARRGDAATAAPAPEDRERTRRIALLSAFALTIAPLSNRMATSAQPETCFSLLVLSTAWALERRRPFLAGALLAGACLIRYEAWGAIPALALHRALRRRDGPGFASFAIPAAAVVGWILLRHAADGAWLVFLRDTQSFASGVRAASGLPALVDAIVLPIVLPLRVLGPAIVLVPLGIRRSLRAGWVVPGGVAAFLVASYAGRGALGLDRYLASLVPFACVAVADGALRLAEMRPRVTARAAAGAALVALGVTAAVHLGWMVYQAEVREAELRRYEAEVMAL